jgi:hypothetical protein
MTTTTTRNRTAIWSFLTIGMGLLGAALALTIPGSGAQRVHASHLNEHRLIVGLATTDAVVTTWYSELPVHNDPSLDLIKSAGGDDGTSVYWQSNHTGGSKPVSLFTIMPLGDCKQTRVEAVADSGGSPILLGRYRFTHVDNALDPNIAWTAAANGSWTIRFVGSVAANDTCDEFTGVHLHQGTVGSPFLFQNDGLMTVAENYVAPGSKFWPCPAGTDPCRIRPTGDYVNRWVHRFSW